MVPIAPIFLQSYQPPYPYEASHSNSSNLPLESRKHFALLPLSPFPFSYAKLPAATSLQAQAGLKTSAHVPSTGSTFPPKHPGA